MKRRNKSRKIWQYLKKAVISRQEGYVLARAALFAFTAAAFHLLFLMSSQHKTARQMFAVVRTVGFLLALWQLCLLFLQRNGEEGKRMTLVEALGKGLRRIAGRFFGLFISASEWFSRLFVRRRYQGNDIGILSDYQDEQIRIAPAQKEKKRKRRWKNWSKMDNRERVRYLYAKRQEEAEKRGVGPAVSDTPNELQRKLERARKNREIDQELFPLYNNVRYRDEFEVTDRMLEKLLVFRKKNR